jgi:hypothetical protein
LSRRIACFASLAGLIVVLAACAESRGAWQKAGADDDRRFLDSRYCRDYARSRMNSRAVREVEYSHGRALDLEAVDRNDDMAGLRRMMEAGHLRLRDRFVADCMRAKGYRRAIAKSVES